MLLDGLLRLKQPMFPDDLLDDIERFTHDTGEHPFQIPERVAAINAARLRALAKPPASAHGESDAGRHS